MRIWSIHPKYLDTKGLVALWRETLLAKHVLEGRTKGYKNHPQLNRFKEHPEPLKPINQYLESVYKEAVNRGYNFDKSKFTSGIKTKKIQVTQGQVDYEFNHLLKKLKIRDREQFKVLKQLNEIEAHPLFTIVPGNIENWEIL